MGLEQRCSFQHFSVDVGGLFARASRMVLGGVDVVKEGRLMCQIGVGNATIGTIQCERLL